MAKRRPEILRLLEENQFGRTPPRPRDMTFDVFDKGTPAFGGKAIRKQVTVHFSRGFPDQGMDLLIYLPAKAKPARCCSTSPSLPIISSPTIPG